MTKKEKFKLNIPRGWRGRELPFLVFLFGDELAAEHLLHHVIGYARNVMTAFDKTYILLQAIFILWKMFIYSFIYSLGLYMAMALLPVNTFLSKSHQKNSWLNARYSLWRL